MNLLIDTHALLWWFSSPARVPAAAQDELEDDANQVYVSAVVAWEMAIKTQLGKLDAGKLLPDLPRHLAERGFRKLAISMGHALRAGQLPLYHKDPFDRILIAQAQAHRFAIVSGDMLLDRYGIRRVWR